MTPSDGSLSSDVMSPSVDLFRQGHDVQSALDVAGDRGAEVSGARAALMMGQLKKKTKVQLAIFYRKTRDW